jgi:glycerol uptake facilitator-like aquaporin
VSGARFDLPRRLVAEALGTAFLLATVVGSGIMAERLAGGNLALALLGNTIPTGAMLVVLITVFGPISGAHFNPAVSAALALSRKLPRHELILYVVAQLAGGVAGSVLAHGMFELPLIQVSVSVRTGPGQWLGESTAAFGLLLTIFGCMRFRPAAVPWCVGLYITAAYWFTSSTSFANPAVTIARGLSDTFAGIRPADVPAFIVAQLAGALAASLVAGWLFAEPKKQRSSTTACSGIGPAARVK